MKNKSRKSNRLKGYDYSKIGFYFITICTQNKTKWFGKIENGEMQLNDIGKIVKRCWLDIPKHFPHIDLGEYIVMPNHIHGILKIENPNIAVGNNNYCSPNGGGVNRNKIFCSRTGKSTDGFNISCEQQWQTKWSKSISSAIRGFKIGVTKQINKMDRNKDFCSLQWQKSFFDHIIRNEKSLSKITDYIICNPSKWEDDEYNKHCSLNGGGINRNKNFCSLRELI